MVFSKLHCLSLFLSSAWAQQVAFQRLEFHHQSHDTSEWTQFNHTIKHVAVIGAGPAGLQAAAALVEHNFTVRLFDRAPGPGGNWFYSEEIPVRESYPDEPLGKQKWVPDHLPVTQYYQEGNDGVSLDERWREHWLPRPIWDSLSTNSPAVITELPDVPYLPDHPWVIPAHTIQTHVRAYASLHKLNVNDNPAVTAYSTRVEKLAKKPNSSAWTLTLKHLKKLEESHRIKATWWTEEFDAVVVAAGPYDQPHVPNIEGLIEWSKVRAVDDPSRFSVYHSRVYRTPQRYTGKNVLVVGVGTSGSEIARDIIPYAKKVYASSKKYVWDNLHPFQRRSFRRFPPETEFIPEIASFSALPSFDNGIKAGKITLVNGSVLEGIDEIILATGYKRSNSFLSAILNGTLGNKFQAPSSPPSDVFNGNPLRNVHWTGHYIPDPTLAFTNVRPWTIGQYQSYALAKVWEGTARIPNEAELWRQYNGTRYTHFRGLFGTGPSEAIVRQYVAWLNNESLEHGGRLVSPWPVQNWEVFSYYANQEWEKDYITRENFTQFEKLPADEWTKADVWDASVLEDEFW
ncbi:FAD/NAD-P-binding domain-containing protein [Guyanagaster necrorhizus]|uniref:FAD/NAD-P-binding domain-containing protein n=1 Tax=Guyanagaster necrorhizus TaxID=856835 RepID=A0A9P8APC0_9AGAR|nr:FAD/NAD-P-binding domain-containing protein [Guyanagaster necrorhizus MCA 3950]KAG7443178.1 FAD/NAD-P-binding domain-containing protein [Guyanagaster necrorhizus MCA 3950]